MKDTAAVNSGQIGFDRGYKWLHWVLAVLFLLMLFALLGFSDGITQEERLEMLVGHSSIGTIISLLVIIRVFKRFVKRDSQPVQNIPGWQLKVSKIVQMGLYGCMVIVPITGYLTARIHELPVMAFGSFNLNQGGDIAYNAQAFTDMRSIHELAITIFIVLLVLHIGAALYHKLIKKDQVMASMTRL